ncbi:procathepsin L [Octopus bimaculoides]|uniref:procathepsin L n=1 Tax=Octopus bimaculoides TaxID=37653 RepID=UPI00071E0A17|nr:procathepsin L [Octopus bimaculoides]|eukprot:XP_014770599.1 PREDICTED: cathepsin L1-like [Octopus bimaculoides]
MMLPLLSFIAVFTFVSANWIPNDDTWELYKSTFRKEYRNAEIENFRRAMWEENANFINEHNLEADMGIHTYWLGMNEYADLSNREFQEMMTGFLPQNRSMETSFISNNLEYLPRTVDWRQHGYVTGVKNQGPCGSCWAFSATGSLEGQYFKKYGRLISLSEQILVDCSSSFGKYTYTKFLHASKWNIGNSRNYKKYVEKESKKGDCDFKKQVCEYDRNKVVAFVSYYFNVNQRESALQEAVAGVGPISAAIYADSNAFRFYKHGIYKRNDCNHHINHAILVVGYGTENGQDYWLVKNSWGQRWGDHGYIKMARNYNNMCRIASLASYPIVR